VAEKGKLRVKAKKRFLARPDPELKSHHKKSPDGNWAVKLGEDGATR